MISFRLKRLIDMCLTAIIVLIPQKIFHNLCGNI